MALRRIYKEGEAVLKKKSKPVTKFDGRFALLVDDMIETVKDANGVGLAAPQVGILKRLIVIDAGGEMGVVELANPEIIRRVGEQVYYEGCLSYPGYYGNVGRPESVTIRAHNRKGEVTVYEATGLYAVACCHEVDHLEGVMFMPKVKWPLYTLEEVKAMRAKAEAGESPTGESPAGESPAGESPASKSPADGESPAGGESGDDGKSAESGKSAEGYMRRIS